MNKNIEKIINEPKNIDLGIKEIVEYIQKEFGDLEMKEIIETFDYPTYGIIRINFNDFLQIQFNTRVHGNHKEDYGYLEDCDIVNYKDGLCEIIFSGYIKILKENKEGIIKTIKSLYK